MKKCSDVIKTYTDAWGNERVSITQKWLTDNQHKSSRSYIHKDILEKATKLGYVSPTMYNLINQ